MVTSEQFIEKIEQILNYYNLSASLFAEKIGVQRSSLSHLLSGRNKPSLDFVIKIVEEFPEVDLYWFLFNQGQFPKVKEKREKTIAENLVFEKNNFENSNNAILSREVLPLNLFDTIEEEKMEKPITEDLTKYYNTENTSTIHNNLITSNIIENENNQTNYFKTEDKQENHLVEKDNKIKNENIPLISNIETKKLPKVKKLILIYDDGFFEEYNYR